MSKPPMDFLPLIPGCEGMQNAVRPTREAFQDIRDGKMYPKSTAIQMIKCVVDSDLNLKENAERVLKINDAFNDDLETLENAAEEIMEQYGNYLIKLDRIEEVEDLKERIRLKHCDLFQTINTYYVDNFGLLQKSDLLPDAINKYLDYRINRNIHLCDDCMKKPKKTKTAVLEFNKCDKIKRKSVHSTQSKKDSIHRLTEKSSEETVSEEFPKTGLKGASKIPFKIIPDEIKFHNCDIGKTYKKTVKLLNISTGTQSLVTKVFPKSHTLFVNLDIGSKLASGMSCYVTVTYKPDAYRNFTDIISFRNQVGFTRSLKIAVMREPPRLIACICNFNSFPMDRPKPGSPRFSESRREALNTSVDCGSCLVGAYNYLTVFLQNKSLKGRFFIITEDEWYFENIESISTSMEYASDCLWIYPTFFELDKEGTIELSILFHPSRVEMYLEKFYIMCDNNTFQQFEVIGDGLKFNMKMIKIDVPPNDIEVNAKEDYCIFFGHDYVDNSLPFTVTIHNTGSLVLKCHFALDDKNVKGVHHFDESCIEMKESPMILAPYSTTDFKFKLNLKSSLEGYHNICLSILITDIPVLGLEGDVKCLPAQNINSNKQLVKCVDVKITEIELACYIEQKEEASSSIESSTTSETEITMKPPKVTFSSYFLDFGILPNGLSVQKPLWVLNLSKNPTEWKIVEVKYNVDSPPYMEVIHSKNISCDAGEFSCLCAKKRILYNVTKKGPVSWVSMLLLLSVEGDTVYEIQSLCIVTYQIINYDITINNSEYPVICPMRMMFTGVPHFLTMQIQNHSPITGLYYFLKPYGSDTKSVDIKINPNQNKLRPLQTRSVEVEIICSDVGIFKDIYIPCFVNKGQECILVRLLCAVDSVHMAMYLPSVEDYHQKVMWPPKVLLDYDRDWMICPCTLEYAPIEESSRSYKLNASSIQKDDENNFRPGDNTPIEPNEVVGAGNSLYSINTDSTGSTNILSRSTSKSEVNGALKKLLQKEFGDDLFLQDYVVEVYQVPLKTPTKVTFYVENITPISTNYTVEATNFYTTRSFDKLAHQLKLKKKEEIWNDMIINEHGILVQPDLEEGRLSEFGVVEITLTIFANTWGVYQEEIAVDVSDIPCFTFSLLIEVVGAPIVFPIALSRNTLFPTLRLGSIAYYTEEIQRKIKVSNTSDVQVTIAWHTFVKTSWDRQSQLKFNTVFDLTSNCHLPGQPLFDITDEYYGREHDELFTILPRETILEKNSTGQVEIFIKPENFPSQLEKTDVKCTLVGRIFLKADIAKKANYFYRDANQEEIMVKMEISFALEMPILSTDFVCEEANMRFYANDVIVDRNFKESQRLVFQNKFNCAAEVEMSISEPLEILGPRGGGKANNYVVEPLSHLEIEVNCKIDHQKILRFSEAVYPKKGASVANLMEAMNLQNIDRDLKIVHIRRALKIVQHGRQKRDIPIDVYIHYPNISTNPTVMKFDQVYLANTRKSVLTIFNHTGCAVNFEIYKSLASEEVYVKPHYGEIAKSTGNNKSFVNIFVYFTPRFSKQYLESIRIVTNIPNYFVEVPIKGSGIINEKFYTDYKI